MMSCLLASCALLQQLQAHSVVLTGGPALRRNEDLRRPEQQHDRWWANFIRASTIRFAQLQAQGQHNISWLVYKPAYALRAREDGKNYIGWIEDLARKYKVRLVWVSDNNNLIGAINQAGRRAGFSSFDYFGHSNQYCFMLDYSSDFISASQCWLHEQDLYKISPACFSANALCKSYGCLTGLSMSHKWRQVLNVRLLGNTGKTNYVSVNQGLLPNGSGRWVD